MIHRFQIVFPVGFDERFKLYSEASLTRLRDQLCDEIRRAMDSSVRGEEPNDWSWIEDVGRSWTPNMSYEKMWFEVTALRFKSKDLLISIFFHKFMVVCYV